VVKVRRVGNSNVLSLPREFVRGGYEVGQPVTIEQLDSGELLIRPVPSHDETIIETMRAMVTRHRRVLDVLADHDSADAPSALDQQARR
jgi:antitoxin component of MazEF toxin-antitoxin module